jgi:hypothetical protein
MTDKTNLYLSKALKFLDQVSGHSARDWKVKSTVLAEAQKKGITPLRAQRKADVEGKRAFKTQLKTGVGIGAAGTAGFLGIHKYHQHQDNKILKKIDNMYNGDHEYR